MSSNQNKKVASIAGKLTRKLKRKKLRMYGLFNIVTVAACLLAYVVALECGHFGYLAGGNARELTWSSGLAHELVSGSNEAVYREELEAGRSLNVFKHFFTRLGFWVDNADKADNLILYRSISCEAAGPGMEADMTADVFEWPIMNELLVGLAAMIGLRVLELIVCTLATGRDRRRIRRILRPIDEIAARADELTRLEFDETKYHYLEEKIAGLNPEDSLDVSQDDSEIQSIENAINNLLMRMRESNRQQARFVNDASHELRTPIAVIEGYANMLSRWGREDEKVLDESIQAIQHESSHMKYLVEQLLFLARGDSGKTVLKPESISLTDMMREIYEESLMIDEKHIYRFDVNEGEDVVFTCDPALVKQAVRILVDNAAKYTAEKDEISLKVGRDEEGRTYLQVEDTGIGMAEADVAHMFERFYRSDEVRSFKGTGLGLSIAKWIVDKHNGHFEVLSREGIGTRIRVVFETPVAKIAQV